MEADRAITETKLRWDRNWTLLRVSATFDEAKTPEPWPIKTDDEISEHRNDVMTGWSGHLIELPTPVLLDASVTEIISTADVRIYPPFRLNKKNSVTALFDDVQIPIGGESVLRFSPIPDHAVKGIDAEQLHHGTFVANGLRVDTRDGVRIDQLLEFLLGAIRQYTFQWWVNSPRSPFDIGVRIDFGLKRDFRPQDLLKSKGSGIVKSPWHGSVGTQSFIGLEKPLTAAIWKQVGVCIKTKKGIEPALTFYLDAIDDFMSYHDTQCILNLALVFEVCENKNLLMSGSSIKSKNKDLLRNPTLTPKDKIEIFRKLITDRDNVAHGRPPHHFRKDSRTLLHYLEATTELIISYLGKCEKYGWYKATDLSL